MTTITDLDREKDIQAVCYAIITASIQSAGDYGSGGQCPFCYVQCRWDANDVSEIAHEKDCVVLIAKDLSTNVN